MADANDPKLEFRVVLPRERNHEYQIEDFGDDWIMRTNWQAKKFRIVRVPMIRVAERTAWRDVVAHRTDGLVDVVTTMLDASIPLTTNEYDEWGNPEGKAAYDYMLSYSPYDQITAKAYPATLVTAGLWDSQVQYYEPAKWVARLRARKTDSNPLLLKMNMTAGHGGRSGRFQRFRDTAEMFAFLFDQWGITVVDKAATRESCE